MLRRMLEAFHLKAVDYRAQPWKNGQGETLEIAVDVASDPFRWRLSRATISSSAPFSSFPGYQRTLVILSGGPVSLIHDGKEERRLLPLVSYSFKGDWETRANIVMPAEDFNVFALDGKSKASVYPTYFSISEDMQFPIAAQEHFIFCVEGRVDVLEPNTRKSLVLEPGETFRFSRKSKKEFLNIRARCLCERAVCLWIVIHLL